MRKCKYFMQEAGSPEGTDIYRDDQGPGYHIASIAKGELGEISKIEEEFSEFIDATRQDVTIMQLVELSDLFGAIEAWLIKYHPAITIDQVLRMKSVTQRAFKNGHRGRK